MPGSARATVTLEFPIPDSWGDDCALGQVYKQAEESARERIRSKLSGPGVVITAIKIDAVIYPSKEKV